VRLNDSTLAYNQNDEIISRNSLRYDVTVVDGYSRSRLLSRDRDDGSFGFRVNPSNKAVTLAHAQQYSTQVTRLLHRGAC